MERIAALASNVVPSMPIVFPFKRPFSASNSSTQPNTARCVSTSINRRVRDPQFLLSSLLLFSTHSHAQILRISAVDHTIFFLKEPRLSPRTARMTQLVQEGFVKISE